MRRCPRCDRHVFEASLRCPFCGAVHRVVANPSPVLGVLLGLTLASCTDRPTDDAGGSASASTSGAATGTTGESATGPLTGVVDDTTTTMGPATTAMTDATADGDTTGRFTTSDGTTSGTGDGTTSGTTLDSGDDAMTVPPYAGAFPDDGDAASTTGDPAP